jgi:hypothetical protein
MATAKDRFVSSQAALDEGRANPPVARSRIAERAPTVVNRGWVQSLVPIAVFDIAAHPRDEISLTWDGGLRPARQAQRRTRRSGGPGRERARSRQSIG